MHPFLLKRNDNQPGKNRRNFSLESSRFFKALLQLVSSRKKVNMPQPIHNWARARQIPGSRVDVKPSRPIKINKLAADFPRQSPATLPSSQSLSHTQRGIKTSPPPSGDKLLCACAGPGNQDAACLFLDRLPDIRQHHRKSRIQEPSGLPVPVLLQWLRVPTALRPLSGRVPGRPGRPPRPLAGRTQTLLPGRALGLPGGRIHDGGVALFHDQQQVFHLRSTTQ